MDPSFFQFFQVFQFQRPFHYYILKFRYQTTQCPSPFLGFSLIPVLSFSEIFIFLNILQYFKCWSKGQVTRSGHKARSQGQVTMPGHKAGLQCQKQIFTSTFIDFLLHFLKSLKHKLYHNLF